MRVAFELSAKFQHTAARRRLLVILPLNNVSQTFQHTAARRRLLVYTQLTINSIKVSTHSRPKAAAAITTTYEETL